MFSFNSPTVVSWLKLIASHRETLLNPTPQMEALLGATQRDVDKQFDENQSRWQALTPYTVRKKKQMKADPRILHETRPGQGLRLRDAYKQAGEITPDGQLVYTYPDSKPYAREHQEGADISQPPKDGKKKKTNRMLAKEIKRLDDEYENWFFR